MVVAPDAVLASSAAFDLAAPMSRNPEADKLKDYAAFDVLRFLLASTVMLAHLGVLRWDSTGNLAVQVFFALSGWLIGAILCGTTRSELARFYYNRSTRIWVPYFLAVFAFYLTSLLFEPSRSSRWLEFLAYDLTFTHNWFTLSPDRTLALAQMPLHARGNHFWSLAVEEQFYLVAPLLLTLTPFGKKILPWICVATVAYVTRSEYASICLGVLAAVVASKYPDFHLRRPARAVLMLVFLGAAAVLVFPSAYGLASPVFSISVVLLCAKPVRRTALTRWLGGVSFPFYLNAWAGRLAVRAVEKHFAILQSPYWLALEFLAGLVGAAISYHVIDARVMAKRHRFYSPLLGWLLGAAGYLLVISGIVFRIHIQI